MSWLDSLLGGGGAYTKAGKAAEKGFTEGINDVANTRTQIGAEFAPYLQTGQQGLTAFGDSLGLNGGDKARLAFENYQLLPQNDAFVREGTRAITNAGGAQGSLLSGETLRGLFDLGNDYAYDRYTGYQNQLSGLAELGANMTSNKGAINADLSRSLADLYSNRGLSKAAAIIGKSNAQKGFLGDVFSFLGDKGGDDFFGLF